MNKYVVGLDYDNWNNESEKKEYKEWKNEKWFSAALGFEPTT